MAKGEFPVPILRPSGVVELVLPKHLGDGPHWIAPHRSVVRPDWLWTSKDYHRGDLDTNQRTMFVFEEDVLPAFSASYGSVAAAAWGSCIEHIGIRRWPRICRWLVPPVEWMSPVHQIACYRGSSPEDFEGLCKRIRDGAGDVQPDLLNYFLCKVLRRTRSRHKLSVYPFNSPFADRFSGDSGDLNSLHEATRWLLRALAALRCESVLEMNLPDSEETWGELVSELAGCSPPHDEGTVLEKVWVRFAEAGRAAGYWAEKPAPKAPDRADCFLPTYSPGTSPPNWDTREEEGYDYPEQKWGMPIPHDWKPGDAVESEHQ